MDYASGFCGSQHKSYYFNHTRFEIHQIDLVAEDERVWADIGYKLQK